MDHQLSMFDYLAEEQDEKTRMLEAALSRGSGFDGGPQRIYNASMTMDAEQFKRFLIDEFGTGGHSFDACGSSGMVDYNPRGIIVRRWADNVEYRYSWEKVAEAFRRMIAMDRFPMKKHISLSPILRRILRRAFS